MLEKKCFKKSRIQETLNLSASADSSIDTKKTQTNLGTNPTNFSLLESMFMG